MSTIGAAVRETRTAIATVFRNRSLRRLNLAQAGSMIGDWAYATAVAVWAYDVGGATAVGVWGTVRLTLAAVSAPFSSALADRMSRRTLMVGCDVVRAVLVLAAAALIELDAPAIVVFVLGTVTTLVSAAFRPAQMALTPSLVETPDELTAANGVGSTIESLAFFLGPAIGGFLLAVADVPVVLVLNALSFVWSAMLIAGVRPRTPAVTAASEPGADRDPAAAGSAGPEGNLAEDPAPPGEEANGGFLREALEGFAVIWRHPDLRLVTLVYCAQTVVAGASLVFGVAIALDLTDLGPAGLGYLDSVLGIGALIGGLLAVALASRHRLASDFGIGVVFWALPLLLVAVWPEAVAAFLAMAVIGAANPVVDVNASTILQRLAPDEVLGRVFGALESALIATMALGSLLMPLLIAGPGLRWGLVAISVPVVVIALLALPALRRMDSRVSEPPEVTLLLSVPLFAPLARPLVEQLAGRVDRVEVSAGDVVVSEGDVGDLFYVIASGALDAQQAGRQLSHMAAGDHFGEIALLRDVPRTATVVATEDSVLLTIQREDFLAALTGDQELRNRTEAVAARRLANT